MQAAAGKVKPDARTRSLFGIGMAGEQRERAVELLGEHDACEFV